MALLNWSESFSVGIGMIDDEHQKLFRLMNELYRHVLEGTTNDSSASRVLDELVAYTQEHFQHEEAMLQQHGYPEFEGHKRQHRRLCEEIEKFRAKGEHRKGVSLELSRFLLDWVLQHVLKDDMRYREFLRDKGVH